jgi:N4-gp56 family major capsid protein
MATITTATAGISSEFPAAFYDRALLDRLLPELMHTKFGVKKNMPKNNGDTIQVRRWERMTAKTTALTEGTVPSESSFSITGIEATVAQYGDFVKFTDMVQWTGLDPVLTELAELLGEAAGDSIDQVVRSVVTAGTSVIYANGSARTAVNTAAGATLFRKARRELKGNNAKGAAQGSDYVAICHPDVIYDLQADTKFEAKGQYVSADNVIETGEVGRIYGIRIMETSNARVVADAGGLDGDTMTSTTGTNADVYLTVVLGKDAYMVVDLEGEGSAKTIFKPLGSAGTADPLNQTQTAGWKANFVAKILNDNAMTRLESAATA